MRYLLCLLPPLAILSCGKPGQMILNIILCFLAYIPGVIHAILVVNKYYADKRHKEMLDAIRRR
ncbi:YqaE/Pmp3 family membrane protein [Paenibacillus contaminans]|uniref:YqaE/Pmp3 family membrane protein n=1 Tax=Paenibacillus contaminans TaxID=450362 RepID=A0A329MKZ4_9BACL|nr:YqaE/Pmp3 family membrane protein [Paenibacillus contaminans]RAV19976.1 YqaE/Pmp3 family membrane protein [Paenibacillus contaminans]